MQSGYGGGSCWRRRIQLAFVFTLVALGAWATAAAAAETAATPSPDTVTLVVNSVQTLRYRLGEIVAALPDLPYALQFIIDLLTDNRSPLVIGKRLAGLFAILAAAGLAEWSFRGLFGAFGPASRTPVSPSEFRRLGTLILRAVVHLLGIAAFALTALLGYLVLHPGGQLVQRAFWGILLVIVGTRIASVLARLVLAPRRADLRLPPIDSRTARSLTRWLVALAAIILFITVFGEGLHLAGLPEPLLELLAATLITLVTLSLLLFVCLQRRAIAALLGLPTTTARSADAGLSEQLLAKWHVFLATALAGMGLYAIICRLLTLQSQAPRVLGTVGVLIAVPLLDGLLRMAVRNLLPPMAPVAPLASQPDAPADGDYAPVIMRNLRMVLAVFVVLVVARLWGIDVALLADNSVGSRAAQAMLTIGLTLILAFAAWGVIKTAINRRVPHEEIDPLAQEDAEGGGGLSRLETLLPLLRKFILVVLVVMTVMICVSALGLNIGPLLAGAGVVGIALGFGAQALVRDIVSGIFFLIDDAFRTGEYIDVGLAKGSVEKISIRSLRLRHHLGQINTIPFGEIKNVTNFSRDWVIMKLELRLPFDTDLERVRKLVKGVGRDMLADPVLGPNFLQPLKSQGVHRMDDSAFIIRVKFMAKPGEQFILRREVYRRLQEVFYANGLRFAPRRVIVDGPAVLNDAAAASLAAETGEPAATKG